MRARSASTATRVGRWSRAFIKSAIRSSPFRPSKARAPWPTAPSITEGGNTKATSSERPKRLRPAAANIVPVSYTHLRAHETDSYLVCRLLLEKKKKKTQNYKITHIT